MGIIRLLLAAAVVMGHSGQIDHLPLVAGRTAVESFFVISGFYMALVIDRKYGLLRTRAWSTFMVARATRLYPVYLLIALLSLGAALVEARISGSDLVTTFAGLSFGSAAIVVIANATMVGQDILMFTGIADSGQLYWTSDFRTSVDPTWFVLLIPAAWSVSLEIAFYVIAPWLARRSTAILFGLLTTSLAIRVGLSIAGLSNDPWSYRFFPTELAFFIAGMLAYRLGFDRMRKTSNRWAGATALGCVVAGIFIWPYLGEHELVYVVTPFLIAIAIPSIFRFSQGNALDRWVGDLSYPVYLSHVLVLHVIGTLGSGHLGALFLPAVLAFSALLLVVVEHPVDQHRQKMVRRRLAATERASSIDLRKSDDAEHSTPSAVV